MTPVSLCVPKSLQHGPHSLVLTGVMRPLIKVLRPTMFRDRASLATIRPIATSAICRSDENKGPTIDNTAMPGQVSASKVDMKKAGEKLIKKAAGIKGRKSDKFKEQTETEKAASKKVAAEKAAAKKEAAKKIAAEKAASKKALASVKKVANEEAAAKKVGAMKATKRKTTLKATTQKTQDKTVQDINFTEKAAAKKAKKVVKKDALEREAELPLWQLLTML